MQITALVVGWTLLGQLSDGGLPRRPPSLGTETPSPRSWPPANTSPPAAASPGRHATRPADLLADAARLPAGATATGQPLTLLAALSATADRRGQAEIVRAYWRLFEAAADYRYALDSAKSVESLRGRGSEEATLRACRAAAAAQARQSELDAARAQHELAGLLRLPADAPLPLCADRPYIGAYETHFKEQFAARTPPETARLADKLLPLQRQVIDDRAEAVQAAEDALRAVSEDYQIARSDAAAVTACSRELERQRQALVSAACDYNRTIADYVFLVVPPTSSPQELVRCLIGPAAAGTGGGQPGRPAGAGSPTAGNSLPPREPTLARRPRPGEPAPAPPPDGWRSAEPALAPPLGNGEPGPQPRPRYPSDRNEPTLAPPLPRTTNKPILASGVSGDDVFRPVVPARGLLATQPAPWCHGLAAASPALQAKYLTVGVHEDYAQREGGSCSPVSLRDCLLRDAGGNRRATVDAYWTLWQRAAESVVLAGNAGLLDALVPVVLERRNDPTGAADMLRLQAAQMAAKAAASQARVALVEAQYALALRMGTLADAAWPRASTAPHSGSYLLNREQQPRAVAQSWPIRRLAAVIPALGESVQQRATALVEADAARAEAAQNYRNGAATIGLALEAVAAQTEQNTALLDTLVEYNRTIAEYVLLLRPTAPADKLVESLVVKP